MLTNNECKNAVCPIGKRQARFADAGGLYLQVSSAGSRRWFWKYRIGGAEKQAALGGYPAVSLKEARRARDDARAQKAEGLDPVAGQHQGTVHAGVCRHRARAQLTGCNARIPYSKS